MMIIKQLCVISIPFLLFACSPTKENYVLKIKGSESMNEMFLALKSDFEKKQDSITLIIEGGGSRLGLKAIVLDHADIGLSSFRFNLDSLLGFDHGIKERVVAYDGIVLINHDMNPITKLTNEQVRGIFSGRYTDWSQIGKNSGPILPIVRDSNSGTQKFFNSYFGIQKLSTDTFVAGTNNEIVHEILGKPNSIGYIGMSYFSIGVNNIKVPSDNDSGGSFIDPAPSNILNGTYPLKRALNIYYSNEKAPYVKAFLKYLSTNEARNIIESLGLVAEVNSGEAFGDSLTFR